jgi:hypothetical protein
MATNAPLKIVNPKTSQPELNLLIKEMFIVPNPPAMLFAVLLGDPSYEWEEERRWDLMLAQSAYPSAVYIFPWEEDLSTKPFLLPKVKQTLRAFAEHLNAVAFLKALGIEAEKVRKALKQISVEATESYTLEARLEEFVQELHSPFFLDRMDRLAIVRQKLSLSPNSLDLEKERYILCRELYSHLQEIGDLLHELLEEVKFQERLPKQGDQVLEDLSLFEYLIHFDEEEEKQKKEYALLLLIRKLGGACFFVGLKDNPELAKCAKFFAELLPEGFSQGFLH